MKATVALARGVWVQQGRGLKPSCSHPSLAVTEDGKRLVDLCVYCLACGVRWRCREEAAAITGQGVTR